MFQWGTRRRIVLPTIVQNTATNVAILNAGLGAYAVLGKIWGGSNATLPTAMSAHASWDGILGSGLNNLSAVFTGQTLQALNQTEVEAPWFMFFQPGITAATGFIVPMPSDRFQLRITLAAGTNITGATLDYWPIYGPLQPHTINNTPGLPS
jgi:hypothetical protein